MVEQLLKSQLSAMATMAADIVMEAAIAAISDWPGGSAMATAMVSLPDGVKMTVSVAHASWRGDKVRAAFKSKQETANG